MSEIKYDINDLTQLERVDYSKKILELAKKQHDKILESVITAEMGYVIAINGNTLQGIAVMLTDWVKNSNAMPLEPWPNFFNRIKIILSIYPANQ